VFSRSDGRCVWSLVGDRRSRRWPTVYDLHFAPRSNNDRPGQVAKDFPDDLRIGDVYEGRLKGRGKLKNWIRDLFQHENHDDPSAGTVDAWQAVHICEKTNTLVWCCNRVICLLKDYKRFFQDTTQDPDWFVAYNLIFSKPNSCAVRRVLVDERHWLLNGYDVETALSVLDGRALWVSAFPVLLDWRSADSVEQVRINLLLHHEALPSGVTKFEPHQRFNASACTSESKHEMFRLNPSYKRTLRGCSSAVLTETAAYTVETQVRWTTRKGAQGARLGAYGPEPEESVALRTVRCFDWGRSALLCLDKWRLLAEIESLTE